MMVILMEKETRACYLSAAIVSAGSASSSYTSFLTVLMIMRMAASAHGKVVDLHERVGKIELPLLAAAQQRADGRRIQHRAFECGAHLLDARSKSLRILDEAQPLQPPAQLGAHVGANLVFTAPQQLLVVTTCNSMNTQTKLRSPRRQMGPG